MKARKEHQRWYCRYSHYLSWDISYQMNGFTLNPCSYHYGRQNRNWIMSWSWCQTWLFTLLSFLFILVLILLKTITLHSLTPKLQTEAIARYFIVFLHFTNLFLSSIYRVWIVRSTVPHLCASWKQFACAGSIWQMYKWLWINHESSQLLITDKVPKKPLAEQSEGTRECKMPWRNVSSFKKSTLP